MENLDLKQMSQMVNIIAEEKGLERDIVLGIVEQAIAAAWRKEAGEREMNVRATLNTTTGAADVYVSRTVIEDGVGYNPAVEIPLSEAIAAVESGNSRRIAHATPQDIEIDTEVDTISAEAESETESETAAEKPDTDDTEKAENADNTGNTETGTETVYDVANVSPVSDANENDDEIHLGDIIEEKIPVTTFGRVAAMTAKQVVIQRLREAENDAVLVAFEDKVGTVVTGTVSRIEPKLVRIDLGRASGIMPRSEQIDGEFYSVGHRIKVFIKNIERSDRGTQLILSRGNAEFIEYLFRQEVPELANGTVEIRGIAREAGRRTKIAVVSSIPGIDPVGTFVGGRGIRVQAVMNEIGDREKIDIINWSDNNSEYIREALSPAEIAKVEIDGKKAKVYVTEDQQKIAIGTKGQNVRLASKLTGFDIDIELLKTAGKKKRRNIEDSLLSAVEESEEYDESDSDYEASADEIAAEISEQHIDEDASAKADTAEENQDAEKDQSADKDQDSDKDQPAESEQTS